VGEKGRVNSNTDFKIDPIISEPEFPSVNVYRDKFTEIGKNAFIEISRDKREKLFQLALKIFQ
jgi:hypothetical protein